MLWTNISDQIFVLATFLSFFYLSDISFPFLRPGSFFLEPLPCDLSAFLHFLSPQDIFIVGQTYFCLNVNWSEWSESNLSGYILFSLDMTS